ncbi:hypothetical protein [Trichormus variabilis]|uniref:Uncharacterized protein n=1 Tax=Trichormus variabilis SAG 1403-4b TaxID=447716 RepID=A0A3S1A3U2_ANAVA|nr:hypothetical protein [Trichormus variabilis]MBD2629671.1 hypothetical protein [Trichormus variabilis FACHB-164]RUS92911.1 hypothetical protein DSM107003_46580 [Trichormus variabilis SAG 1403-4b]
MSYQVEFENDCLQKRFKELRVTLYYLAQRFNEIRETNSPASRWHSTIDKLISNPQVSKLITVDQVIRLMGGKLIIEWEDVENVSLLDNEVDERISNVEKSIEDVKDLLMKLIETQQSNNSSFK